MAIRELLKRSKIIPVLALNDPDSAIDLARALCKGGATVLEITLRTPAAFDIMAAIKSEVPEASVGAGTVNTCLLYTSPSPRDGLLSRMPSSA